MSSTFSLHSNISDEELPSYEEVSLPPNVTIEEREISSDDEDEDDYEQSETRKTIKQSTKTFASIKSFLSGSVAPPAEFTKSIITFDQTVVPSRPKADRKPSFKLAPIQTSTLQSRRNAMRSNLRMNNTV
ncbi:hypothetical protein D6C84_00238 [Aureobasidium pullulans]|uniref:Uncharacterized protein n=1 Tax=Aureobasidium pullulans TaxID=5580 RepID=A0A4S8SNJ0_AURPU|nr:hypothetical protein D6D28_03949 [Aureobasidium pullulans]THY92512.1 hypothetical protein D6C93_05932 [Aureobasidium pullulans]THZ89291.1 hypothetical protein D6C84_00238 [Aureobasidium pullulans]